MMPDDALERELESFRPRSPTPEFRRRIGRRIGRRRLGRIWSGVGIALVAAGIAGIMLAPRPPVVLVEPPPAIEAVPPPSSVQAYRSVLAKSPATLDALLDEQAVRSGQPDLARAGIVPDLLTLKGTRE